MMIPRSFSMYVAGRYLKPSRRNRFLSFITAVAVIGVTLGTCALLVSLSILRGFDQQLRTTIIDFMGHIEINPISYSDNVTDAAGIESIIRTEFPEIRSVSPFLRREAILRSSDGLEGVLLKGIDPSKDLSTVREKIISGSFLDAGSDGEYPSMVVGQRLAEKLHVAVNDTVVLFIADGTPDINTPPLIEQFVIRGTYRSGMAQYDDIYVFSTISGARSLLSVPDDEVSGYDVMLHDPEQIEEVSDRLNERLGLIQSLFATPVFVMFRSVFAWIDLQRLMIPVVMAIIAIVATFNVVSTLLMTVLEKTQSIATLSTLGATPSGIMRIFVSKGVLVTGTGVITGSVLTLIFSLLQQKYGLIGLDASIYVFDAVPIAIDPLHYVVVIVGTILLSILATLVPAAIASRLRPVATMRFQG